MNPTLYQNTVSSFHAAYCFQYRNFPICFAEKLLHKEHLTAKSDSPILN